MDVLKQLEPNVFVDVHEPLPEALKANELDRLREDSTLAAFTYIRQECQRCHHAVKGRQERGDFRGIGCSSCHTPYSYEGFYEGNDPTIDKAAPGHMLVHSIQGTREAKVTVHDTTYSGIPVEKCTTCHDRGKRIGVSFQGLMETPYHSPYAADGGPRPELHTKHYIAMEQDVHYQKGMLCQDCHTSNDVHGDGFLAAANLAAVQIECSDCPPGNCRSDSWMSTPWNLPRDHRAGLHVNSLSIPAKDTFMSRAHAPGCSSQWRSYFLPAGLWRYSIGAVDADLPSTIVWPIL